MCGTNRGLIATWLTLAIVLPFSFAVATASQPDPLYSSVEFQDLLSDTLTPLICLEGNGSWLKVTVRDENDAPVAGAEVELDIQSSCPLCNCTPSSTTDSEGVAEIRIQAGLEAPFENCCTVTATVTCLGDTIPWKDSGASSDTRDWLTYDRDANCVMDSVDLDLFADDMGTSACRSDFNLDGSVNMLDPFIFLPHQWDECVVIQDVDPSHSSVQFQEIPCDTIPTVCPQGDGTWIKAIIHDENNAPIEGEIVELALQSSCGIYDCTDPALTDSNGVAEIRIRVGLMTPANGQCCPVTATVTSGGETIPWAGSGSLSDTRDWRSIDLNADGQVDADDDSIMAEDLSVFVGRCRTDYNCDGVTSTFDLFTFLVHPDHACDMATGVGGGEVDMIRPQLLEQNNPNPFNPTTQIAYNMERPGKVTLRIYNVVGQSVITLVDEWKAAGHHQVTWDGRDDRGISVSAGVYISKLDTSKRSESRKMLLIK